MRGMWPDGTAAGDRPISFREAPPCNYLKNEMQSTRAPLGSQEAARAFRAQLVKELPADVQAVTAQHRQLAHRAKAMRRRSGGQVPLAREW
jgi:hypothetical protein